MFYIVSVVALVILVYLFINCPPENLLMRYALAFITGGALGNLYDRIMYKEVVDFLDIGITSTLRWPTFNVADIAITIGVFMVLLETIISFRKEQKKEPVTAN